MQHRGIPEITCRAAGIGATVEGMHAHRVIVPVRTVDGTLAGWVGRDYTGVSPRKYVNSKGMPRRSLLFNAGALATAQIVPVIVVEGVFDALPVWPHAVAVLGKPSEEQLRRLRQSGRAVAFAFDADTAQLSCALAAQFRLWDVQAGWVALPSGTDPGDADPSWLIEQAKACIDRPLW